MADQTPTPQPEWPEFRLAYRVWRYRGPSDFDADPGDGVRVVDQQGDVWERQSFWVTSETRPFPWGYVVKKWGPLVEHPLQPDMERAVFGEPCDGSYTPTDGAALIAAERHRQIAGEGWTAAHDDQHTCCELAQAAVAYLEDDTSQWPWDLKPSFHDGYIGGSYLDRLVKAGALVAAEIDRLQRAEGGGRR